jgi:hypothetical protein
MCIILLSCTAKAKEEEKSENLMIIVMFYIFFPNYPFGGGSD